MVGLGSDSSSYDSRLKPSSYSSVMSGIKSVFCSKKSSPSIASTRFSSSADRSFSSASYLVSPSHVSAGPSNISQTLAYPRRQVARIKTSDSFPILSPQLEDRMLQLADRSRRLGVHRFSRTRNTLILNQYTSSIHRHHRAAAAMAATCPEQLTRAGSATSLSTQPSTPYRQGSIQKVSLPGLGLSSQTILRE